MEQTWFEMPEIRRRKFATAVWIPLRATDWIERSGRYGTEDYKEEFFGLGHIVVPVNHKSAAERMKWDEVGIRHNAVGYVDDGSYYPAHVYRIFGTEIDCEYLVLDQHFNSAEPDEWHLSQDLIVTLGLKREDDVWLRPDEGYIEVARLTRNSEGEPTMLEVRASHLRDYLCARNMALYLSSCRNRVEISKTTDHLSWSQNPLIETRGMDRWQGSVRAIHEGGRAFGEKVAVFHIERTDVDPEEDVPSMGMPTDENTLSARWTESFSGEKLYRVAGELWRTEWVEPSASSPIVRGDDTPSTIFFITNPEGAQENKETLVDGDGRWLWFRPDVITAILNKRGAFLKWYTRDTGQVSCSPDYGTHFGVNALGLVNVYAKDIGLLPDWQQRVWSGYNVTPEGKVSAELLASQVNARPARTKPPEVFLALGLQKLDAVSNREYGFAFLRPHEQLPEILRGIHRFRVNDQPGLFALAKEVARITAVNRRPV